MIQAFELSRQSNFAKQSSTLLDFDELLQAELRKVSLRVDPQCFAHFFQEETVSFLGAVFAKQSPHTGKFKLVAFIRAGERILG